MRDEVVRILTERHRYAKKDAAQPYGITKAVRARRQGFASALRIEIEFWRNMWVDGKQWRPRVRKYDMQGRETKDNA